MVIDMSDNPMIVPEIYDTLCKSGVPLTPVDTVVSDNFIEMECPLSELPKKIIDLEPSFIMYRTWSAFDLLFSSSENAIENYLSKHKSHIDDYISLNPELEPLIAELRKISVHQMGRIQINMVVRCDNSILLGLGVIVKDAWFIELEKILNYVADQLTEKTS